jgi:hypothetical protein
MEQFVWRYVRLVSIQIPDEVWEKVKLSWIPFGVYSEQKLIEMVVDGMLSKSNSVIEDAQKHPENYGESEMQRFRREILKQETEKMLNQKKLQEYTKKVSKV